MTRPKLRLVPTVSSTGPALTTTKTSRSSSSTKISKEAAKRPLALTTKCGTFNKKKAKNHRARSIKKKFCLKAEGRST